VTVACGAAGAGAFVGATAGRTGKTIVAVTVGEGRGVDAFRVTAGFGVGVHVRVGVGSGVLVGVGVGSVQMLTGCSRASVSARRSTLA
jgi:hypothetical protein